MIFAEPKNTEIFDKVKNQYSKGYTYVQSIRPSLAYMNSWKYSEFYLTRRKYQAWILDTLMETDND